MDSQQGIAELIKTFESYIIFCGNFLFFSVKAQFWYIFAFTQPSDCRTTDVSILLGGNLLAQALHTQQTCICAHNPDDWSS